MEDCFSSQVYLFPRPTNQFTLNCLSIYSRLKAVYWSGLESFKRKENSYFHRVLISQPTGSISHLNKGLAESLVITTNTLYKNNTV